MQPTSLVLVLGLVAPLFATIACATDPVDDDELGETESATRIGDPCNGQVNSCDTGQWCDHGKCKPGCDDAADCQRFSGPFQGQECNTSTHQCTSAY